jgi:hypothetical protein
LFHSHERVKTFISIFDAALLIVVLELLFLLLLLVFGGKIKYCSNYPWYHGNLPQHLNPRKCRYRSKLPLYLYNIGTRFLISLLFHSHERVKTFISPFDAALLIVVLAVVVNFAVVVGL